MLVLPRAVDTLLVLPRAVVTPELLPRKWSWGEAREKGVEVVGVELFEESSSELSAERGFKVSEPAKLGW